MSPDHPAIDSTRPVAVGVLLAAGRGRRMGTTKQLLPWPPESSESTVVAASFDLIQSGSQNMIVVLGHEPEQVERALRPRRFHTVLSDPDAEMIASIRAGLRAVIELEPNPRLLVLLHPADCPGVRNDTVALLLEIAAKNPGRAVIPEFRGKGGHPAVIPHSLLESILTFDGGGGLSGFWRCNPELVLRSTVDDPAVTADLDTPADYRRSPE